MTPVFSIVLVLFLLYFPFLFIIFIPSQSILHSDDRHYEICQFLISHHLQSIPYCRKETSLAVIKPDGIRYQANIKQMLREHGFTIMKKKRQNLSDDKVDLWYADKRNQSYYPSLKTYLTSGPIETLLVERVDAVSGLRRLIGPTDPHVARRVAPKSIRSLYGSTIQENAIHASDSWDSVAFERSLLL
ncbi:nucleoside diphosphate kinase [Hesseltinella vesiculosa]|uniref:Nucleoside diphosphate kinase n=1 Tax=Hesseltinella vesiculosa TaxID=101127 RepID=A0A1X2GKZ6_9FUNG|nr:nucleoside diphosphate kinase [Hesseltinella vesiculosa]